MIWKGWIESLRILAVPSESFSQKPNDLFNILTLWKIQKKILTVGSKNTNDKWHILDSIWGENALHFEIMRIFFEKLTYVLHF